MLGMSEALKQRYPGSVIGALVIRGARNPASGAELERIRDGIESDLRARWSAGGREAMKADPVIAAYDGYYRQFRKTYHVALQLESVIWKGRHIESRSPLVTVMFMAELKNMLLTAVHDLARVAMPAAAGLASGTEEYEAMGGEKRILKEGDMFIADSQGVISSIVYGPDQRTAVTAGTEDLLFCVYAPPGIGAERVRAHLEDLRRFVTVAAPGARAEAPEVAAAG